MKSIVPALLVCAASTSVGAQVGEAEVLGAVGNLESVQRARLAQARAEGRRAGVGLAPDPVLSFERQEAFAPNAQSQDLLALTIPIDLSGRRRAERALADAELALLRAEVEGTRLAAAAAALESFYEVLALGRRADVLREGLEAIAEAERVVASRVSAGDAAGYEAVRLALERRRAESRVGEVEAARQAAEAALRGQLDLPAGPFRGAFDVTLPALQSAERRAASERPEMRALSTFADTVGRARRAARSAWVPTFAIVAGYNRQRAPTGQGYALGAEVTLPLFDRGQGVAGEAERASEALDSVQQSVAARVRARVRAAHAALTTLLSTRERFLEGAAAETQSLTAAMLAAYREGERSLVEWLDARRAVVEIGERAVELDLAVRRAEVALREATGELR